RLLVRESMPDDLDADCLTAAVDSLDRVELQLFGPLIADDPRLHRVLVHAITLAFADVEDPTPRIDERIDVVAELLAHAREEAEVRDAHAVDAPVARGVGGSPSSKLYSRQRMASPLTPKCSAHASGSPAQTPRTSSSGMSSSAANTFASRSRRFVVASSPTSSARQ